MICVAIPALLTSKDGCEAVAEVGGQPRPVNVSLTPEVNVGDYVLLSNGYATEVINDEEALEILELLEEINRIESDWYIPSHFLGSPID